jgi:hypothetical protein
MKQLIQIVFLFITIQSVNAQLPGVNAQSSFGSGLIDAPLIPLATWIEPRLEREVKDFREIYEHRAEYYATTAIDNGKIRNEVTDLRDRISLLITDNESLAFFYPFKKRDNRTKLTMLLSHVNRLYTHLGSLLPDSIYGERINLNQNAEMTLEEMHRKVDEIESDIAKSRILSQLLGL